MEDDDVSPTNSDMVVEDDDEESSDYEVVSESSSSSQYDSENSHDDPPLKRLKLVKQDRLSTLPDSMMTHVLSFLPVIDAVKTQLVSKRFRHVWTWITTLSFYSNRRLNKFYDRFITYALMLHRAPSIMKLCLSDIELGCGTPLNMWLQAAVNKRVEELVLKIDDWRRPFSLTSNSLLFCDTLRVFSLTAPEIELGSRECRWKSLVKLTLRLIRNLDDEMLRKIVVGSPALESLSLIWCQGFSRVVIDSPRSRLRSLVIDCYFHNTDDYGSGEEDDYMEISAPKITNLEISGYMGNKHCRLKDVSSLVRVGLRFSLSTMVGRFAIDNVEDTSPAKLEKCECTILDVLRKTSHVEKISIGTWCTQILSLCELRKKPEITLKCKSLEVDGLFEKSLPGIARLLQNSPLLETLIIDLGHIDYDDELFRCEEFSNFSRDNYWKSKRKDLEHALISLDVVQLIGFDRENASLMAELAELVLRHSRFLKKLVFKPGSNYN